MAWPAENVVLSTTSAEHASSGRRPSGCRRDRIRVRTALMSCRKPRKARIFTSNRQPSGESQFMGSLTTGFLKWALIISGMALASMATTAAPLIPIVSFLQHWDHHWYVWLPSDPVYEAVEIMAAERGPNNPPLLWVFFTERAQPKHQINYYNDAKVAAARAADGVTSQFAEIKFAMTGADGEPRGVSAGFVKTGTLRSRSALIRKRGWRLPTPVSPIRSGIAASACCCCSSVSGALARRTLTSPLTAPTWRSRSPAKPFRRHLPRPIATTSLSAVFLSWVWT